MKLSVVIPTYNEELYLPELLAQLSNSHQVHEIIVVDADSKDNTKKIAQSFGALVLNSVLKRRSAQMDLGARVATGNIILFLHADSILPDTFFKDIEDTFRNGADAACFRLKFYPSNAFLGFFEIFVGAPFLICRGGDQGLVVKQTVYRLINGFDNDLVLMEDIDIIRRICRKHTFKIMQSRLKTSSRAYQKYGNLRLQYAYLLTHIRYWLGMDSNSNYRKLKKFLEHERN